MKIRTGMANRKALSSHWNQLVPLLKVTRLWSWRQMTWKSLGKCTGTNCFTEKQTTGFHWFQYFFQTLKVPRTDTTSLKCFIFVFLSINYEGKNLVQWKRLNNAYKRSNDKLFTYSEPREFPHFKSVLLMHKPSALF